MDFLRDRERHFHALVASISDLDNYVLRLHSVAAPNTVIRVVRGRRMQSKEHLLDEFAAAFQFPLYFGRNWDAFEECMADLQWLPAKAYVLVISDASFLLKMEPANSMVVLFEILDRVSREWTDGKLPDINVEQDPVLFHVLLQDEAPSIEDLRRALLPVVGDIPVVRSDAN
ncbi:MAG: barstar family protein [Acidobacteriaceae bacterium]